MSKAFGVVLLLFGLPSAIWPYQMARFGEQLDAIGSKRRLSEVEPADWNVTLTRIVGIMFSLVGFVMLLG